MKKLFKNKAISLAILELFLFTQYALVFPPGQTALRRIKSIEPEIPEATDREVISIPEIPLKDILDELGIPVTIFDPDGSAFVTKVGKGAATFKVGHWEFNLESEELNYLEYRIGDQTYVMEINKTEKGKEITLSGANGGGRVFIGDDGSLEIQMSNGQKFSYCNPDNYTFSTSNGRSILEFQVKNGVASLNLSREGQSSLIQDGKVVEVGDEMVVRVRHDPLPEPENFDQVDEKGFYFLDQITDIDGVILTPTGDTLLMYYDGEKLNTVFYQGRQIFDQVRNASDPETALDSLIANGPPGSARASVDVDTQSRDKRGRWFNFISFALSAIEGAVIAAGLTDFGFVDMRIANYLIGGIMGVILYRMYKRIAKYGLKSFIFPFLDTNRLINKFPQDEEVMQNGLKINQMVVYGFRNKAQKAVNNADNFLADFERVSQEKGNDMTNGKLSLALASSARTKGKKWVRQVLFQELKGWKELSEKYGDRVRIYYFLVNRKEAVGGKYGKIADMMKYILDGVLYPQNYLQYRDGTEPAFKGDEFIAKLAIGDETALDEAVSKGIITKDEAEDLKRNPILTPEEAKQFVEIGILGDIDYLRSGKIRDIFTLDSPDRISALDYIKMEARVVNAPEDYEMFVPVLHVGNPDETILTRFQDRASKLFTPIMYVNSWLFDGQPSFGKVRIKIEPYVRKVWDPEVLDVSVVTSHDHLESTILKTALLLDVKAFDERPPTGPVMERDLMRFSYGDWMNWWREKLPNTRGGKFISKLFGIESKIKPTQVWQREVLQNPTDFVWSDLEFATFLGLSTTLSFMPVMLSIRQPTWMNIVTATVVLGQLILGPLFISPIAYEIKNRNLFGGFAQAIRNKNYSDAMAQMREILGTVIRGTGNGLLTLGEGILYMMPYLALKPMMALLAWGKYRLREKITKSMTVWAKSPPGKIADAVVSLLGAAFGYSLWANMGFSPFMAIGGATIATPMFLWPLIKWWWVNRKP